MDKIAVPEPESFLSTADLSGAEKVCTHTVLSLILGQHFIDSNGDKLPIPVPEPEPYGRDFSVCVRAGNHLHWNINTQYAFHFDRLLSRWSSIRIIT